MVVRGQENLPNGTHGACRLPATHVFGRRRHCRDRISPKCRALGDHQGKYLDRGKGETFTFLPPSISGHSGGPIFQSGKVVGMVGAGSQSVGRGVTVGSVQDYIEGFGITAQDRTSSASMTTESSPPPAATAKPEPRPMTQDREITGKDGAPMVLIPAGEFRMGSPDGEGEKDEHPRHRVYLDAYYMDKFEVTVFRYRQNLCDRHGGAAKAPRSYWEPESRTIGKHGGIFQVVGGPIGMMQKPIAGGREAITHGGGVGEGRSRHRWANVPVGQ